MIHRANTGGPPDSLLACGVPPPTPDHIATPRRGRRLTGLAAAALAVTPLLLAAGMSPAGEGHGTHTQLGLPECTWAATFDAPCASCGMTTSWTWMAHAGFSEGFLTQPFGAFLAVAAAAVVTAGLHAAVAGARIAPLFGWLIRGKAITLLVTALAAAWVYKFVTW